MQPSDCNEEGKRLKRVSPTLNHRLRPNCYNGPGRSRRRGRGKAYQDLTACSAPGRSPRIRGRHQRGHVTGKGRSEQAWQRAIEYSEGRLKPASPSALALKDSRLFKTLARRVSYTSKPTSNQPARAALRPTTSDSLMRLPLWSTSKRAITPTGTLNAQARLSRIPLAPR
jgi:hypothetical protein